MQAFLFLRLECKSLIGFESSVDYERSCRSSPEERKLPSSLYDVKKEGKDGMCSEDLRLIVTRTWVDQGRASDGVLPYRLITIIVLDCWQLYAVYGLGVAIRYLSHSQLGVAS